MKNKSDFEYIRTYYGITCYKGQEVCFIDNGEKGVIVEDHGHYVGVNFYKDKPQHISNCHPNDLQYLEVGRIRRLTRSQINYKNYLESEVCESFAEWMGFRKVK